MARVQKPKSRGFALVFAAVLVAAMSLTVASISSTTGLLHQQASTRKWAILAQAMAEQGLSRALADVSAVTRVKGDEDMDTLLDPGINTGSRDTAACPQTGCGGEDPGSDNYLPQATTVTGSGSRQYAGWGTGTATFQGQTYRRITVGTNAYLVRYDDNLDDTNANYPPSTTTNNGVTEGPSFGSDVPNRDRDQHITVTAVGLAGGTTESSARARHVLRALVRTTGGKAVRAGDYADVDDAVCGAGLQVCHTTNVPACWCGELEYDSGETAPTVPSSACASCTGNCPPASARPVAGLCSLLSPGPPRPPPFVATIDDRATYGTLITGTGTAKGRALFRMDKDTNVNLGSGTLNNMFILHMWDSDAAATCASSAGTLPNPDFNFGAWNLPADCWVPVYMETDAENTDEGCWHDGNSGVGVSGWIQPDCRITTTALDSASLNSTTADRCSNAAGCSPGSTCGTPGWCPGHFFGGFINVLDSAQSSNSDGANSHGGGGGIHSMGSAVPHVRITGARKANTLGLGQTSQITNAINGTTNVTWASYAGCTGCANSNTLLIDLNIDDGAITMHKDGPKGVFLSANNSGALTLNIAGGATPAAPSETGFVFRGTSHLTIAANTAVYSPVTRYAIYNNDQCTINPSFFARRGLWCKKHISGPDSNNVYYMGDITAGDDTENATINLGKNNNQFCSSELTSCPTSPGACTGARSTYFATDDLELGESGGGTGPDICADMRAVDRIRVDANSSNSHISGTVWAGGRVETGNNTEINPRGAIMMGATPSLLSVQSIMQ